MQIPHSDRVRSYELTYLIAGSVTSDKIGEAQAAVTQLLKKNGCSQTKTEEWGKRPMAYKIKNHGKNESDAFYVHVTFDAPTQAVFNLDHDMRLSQVVMRFLIVLAEKEMPTPEVALHADDAQSQEDGDADRMHRGDMR